MAKRRYMYWKYDSLGGILKSQKDKSTSTEVQGLKSQEVRVMLKMISMFLEAYFAEFSHREAK